MIFTWYVGVEGKFTVFCLYSHSRVSDTRCVEFSPHWPILQYQLVFYNWILTLTRVSANPTGYRWHPTRLPPYFIHQSQVGVLGDPYLLSNLATNWRFPHNPLFRFYKKTGFISMLLNSAWQKYWDISYLCEQKESENMIPAITLIKKQPMYHF